MTTKNLHGSQSPSGARLPASSETFHPSPDGHLAQLADDEQQVECDIRRILIVDDDPAILKLVARMAASLGYHPTAAEDAVDALYHLTKADYELVITDYDMPYMDGYQLADRIKENHFGTRVIIMTGNCEQEVADLLDGSGIVDGLLLKPFNLKTMQEKIEMAQYPRSGKWIS